MFALTLMSGTPALMAGVSFGTGNPEENVFIEILIDTGNNNVSLQPQFTGMDGAAGAEITFAAGTLIIQQLL